MFNLINSNFTNDRLGRSGSSLHFNFGSGNIPSLSFFHTGFTLSTWIKVNQLVQGDSSRLLSTTLLIFTTAYLPGKGPYVYFATINYNLFSNTALSLNQWHHLAFTFDGSTTIAIYIDGQQIAFNNAINPITSDFKSDSNMVGTASGSRLHDFELDELKLFKRGLSSSEILKETIQIYQTIY